MDSEQIIGLVRLAAMLIASALTAAGIAADADTIFIALGGIVTAATMVWGWWKNNNMTEAARIGQELLNDFKAIDKATVDRRDRVDEVVSVEDLEMED